MTDSPGCDVKKAGLNAAKFFIYFTQDTPYTSWELWPGMGRLRRGKEPHGAFLTTYVNPVAHRSITGKGGMAFGSLIVVENHGADKKPADLTVLIKIKGYNPDAGDIFSKFKAGDGGLTEISIKLSGGAIEETEIRRNLRRVESKLDAGIERVGGPQHSFAHEGGVIGKTPSVGGLKLPRSHVAVKRKNVTSTENFKSRVKPFEQRNIELGSDLGIHIKRAFHLEEARLVEALIVYVKRSAIHAQEYIIRDIGLELSDFLERHFMHCQFGLGNILRAVGITHSSSGGADMAEVAFLLVSGSETRQAIGAGKGDKKIKEQGRNDGIFHGKGPPVRVRGVTDCLE
jgi:hypothetical protein